MQMLWAYLLLLLHLSSAAHHANLPPAAAPAPAVTTIPRRLLRSPMLLQHLYVPGLEKKLLAGNGGGVSPLAGQTSKMAPAPLPRGSTSDLVTDDRPGSTGEVDIGVDYAPPKSHPPQHN